MAVCLESNGGAIRFTATTNTYSTDKPIMIRGIAISGGTATGAVTLNEGISASTGLADASGDAVYDGYFAVGAQVYLNFVHRPFIADKGLKLSALATGAVVVVYLA